MKATRLLLASALAQANGDCIRQAKAMLRLLVMDGLFEQVDECVAVAMQTRDMARRSQHPLARVPAHQTLAMVFDQTADDQCKTVEESIKSEDCALLGNMGMARNISAHEATEVAREAALAEPPFTGFAEPVHELA